MLGAGRGWGSRAGTGESRLSLPAENLLRAKTERDEIDDLSHYKCTETHMTFSTKTDPSSLGTVGSEKRPGVKEGWWLSKTESPWAGADRAESGEVEDWEICEISCLLLRNIRGLS